MTDSPARLSRETSPYLLQHAANPVEWYPWGEEALARARAEDKPILLSIGYSACHWCHVMAHESFEDADTAALMNELFVNIKVDREERPDLDRIYQTAHQILTHRGGGWPLTMFLTPHDRMPFFGGTYFPEKPRHGLPAFSEVLRAVAEYYRDQRADIEAQHGRVADVFAHLDGAGARGEAVFDAAPLDMARAQLARQFDARYGGFGAAPKFPHPAHIERLLRHFAFTAANGRADERALEMAAVTLTKMAEGGIYDQIGGGFCRYSVDEEWTIPHFEKMLYDNGPLLTLYARAWQITGEVLYRNAALETAGWAMREMQSPGGGYYSSLDADSEGEEGRFYVWTPASARAVLDEREYAVCARRFGLDGPANFEEAWHLRVCAGFGELAREFDLDRARSLALLDGARQKLFNARASRARPGRDEKILTAWNALMIKGMTVAGSVLNDAACLDSAARALAFVRAHLWRDGRLLATCKDGQARHAAYLDDYAFLLDAVLEFAQVRWRGADLAFAVELAEALLAHFEDRARGGFYFTADDHEALIHRPKPYADEALPAGNGVAAFALARLGHLLDEPRYLDAAARTLHAAWSSITEIPYAHETLLSALEEQLYPPEIIVLRGEPEALRTWRARALRHCAPQRLVLAIPNDASDVPAPLAVRAPHGAAVAYVCRGTRCEAPITRFEVFEEALARGEVVSRNA